MSNNNQDYFSKFCTCTQMRNRKEQRNLPDFYKLSKREIECLILSIRGKSARRVSVELKISQRTVEEYLNNVKLKFDVKSKAEMIEVGISYLMFFSE